MKARTVARIEPSDVSGRLFEIRWMHVPDDLPPVWDVPERLRPPPSFTADVLPTHPTVQIRRYVRIDLERPHVESVPVYANERLERELGRHAIEKALIWVAQVPLGIQALIRSLRGEP